MTDQNRDSSPRVDRTLLDAWDALAATGEAGCVMAIKQMAALVAKQRDGALARITTLEAENARLESAWSEAEGKLSTAEHERDVAREERDEARRLAKLSQDRHEHEVDCNLDTEQENARLRGVVESARPFSETTRELFSRNWNDSDVVFALDKPDAPGRACRLTFRELRELHQALARLDQGEG